MKREIVVEKSKFKSFEDILIGKGFLQEEELNLIYKNSSLDPYRSLKAVIRDVVSKKCHHDGDNFRREVKDLQSNVVFFDLVLRIYTRLILNIYDQLDTNQDAVSMEFKEDLYNSVTYEISVQEF